MQNVRNPWWLLIINTLPIVLLASIYYGSFDTIHSLLSPESIRIWKIFSITLGCIWLLHLLYAIFLIVTRRIVSAAYGILAIGVYAAFLYVYYVYSDIAIPFDIPGWMMPEDITLFVGTFIMPTLAHALFVLVVAFTKSTNGRKAWISFGIAFFIPLAWYVFFMVILPLWQDIGSGRYGEHILIVLVLAATAVFLFFIMRGIYIIGSQRGKLWQTYSFIWRFILGVIFPIAGLVVNEWLDKGFFGNFSNDWFYILAAINGIVITLPQLENTNHRMTLFFIRSITVVYVFYFFLVFIPYLPLSVIAIIVIGSGFLMLTPLILIVLQLRIMGDDIRFLRKTYSSRMVYGTLISGILILPAIVTFNYMNDKATLRRALDYVYTPDLNSQPTLNTKALSRVLETVRKGRDRRWRGGKATPYLSTYYNWLVLDNLTLSEQKINLLDRIFNSASLESWAMEPAFGMKGNDPVSLEDIKSSSAYDNKQQAWKTTVELKIQNESGSESEYVTSFNLPPGSWISDYYLWIGKEKVRGILAEKKTATWVYQQIVSSRRDPGILYYLTGDRVALRVFPLAGNETRRTGFEIFHKEPITLAIDNKSVNLGDDRSEVPASFQTFGSATYVSAKAKQRLRKVKRVSEYHFIIDCSISNYMGAKNYINQIETFAAENKVDLNSSSFTLCNAYAKQTSSWEETKKLLGEDIFSGGFFLERAIQRIITRNFLEQSHKQPIMVVVSRNFSNAIVRKDFADLKTAFPESDLFFELSDTKLVPHSLVSSPMNVANSTPSYEVVEWKTDTGRTTYLRLDDQASVFFDSLRSDEDVAVEHNWNSALALHGRWLEQQFYPAKAKTEWLGLVKSSFQSQVMSPVTSFISVENEAQKKVLLKKQAQLLNANPSLDLGEEVRMSEPGLWVAVVMIIFFVIRYRQPLLTRYTHLTKI